MAYLPISSGFVQETNFPEAFGKDLRCQADQIEEMYKRFYTKITYYNLKKATDPSADANDPTGEAGNTKFDPLWGESVPATMEATGWEQPHGSVGVHDPNNPEIYEEPFDVHAKIQREALDLELKKYGFDRVRDLLVTIPLSFFDAHDITVRNGDYFLWDDDEYVVLQHDCKGYWQNTNICLYMVINAEHRRAGS